MDILLIDHNAADAYLTKLALNEVFPDSRVRVAEDGEQALQYLTETENYLAAIHPDLILLDLNIPRLDGLSLLTLI
jgi:CheY-like chemotaxis protein